MKHRETGRLRLCEEEQIIWIAAMSEQLPGPRLCKVHEKFEIFVVVHLTAFLDGQTFGVFALQEYADSLERFG